MILLGLVGAYLLGSLPTAYGVTRWLRGQDIRQLGSGNVGATNAFRVLGPWGGLSVLFLDMAKGAVAVTLWAEILDIEGLEARVLLGVAAVIGHIWTIFLHFRGGKGIATSLGVLLGLCAVSPGLGKALALSVVSWLIPFLLTGYVSLGSIVAAGVLPVGMIVFDQPVWLIILSFFLSSFVLWRHRDNWRRLRSGRESRAPLPYLKRRAKDKSS